MVTSNKMTDTKWVLYCEGLVSKYEFVGDIYLNIIFLRDLYPNHNLSRRNVSYGEFLVHSLILSSLKTPF